MSEKEYNMFGNVKREELEKGFLIFMIFGFCV